MCVRSVIRWLQVRPAPGRDQSFVEIDHDHLSLQLIQEGQLLVSGKRLCTIVVNC